MGADFGDSIYERSMRQPASASAGILIQRGGMVRGLTRAGRPTWRIEFLFLRHVSSFLPRAEVDMAVTIFTVQSRAFFSCSLTAGVQRGKTLTGRKAGSRLRFIPLFAYKVPLLSFSFIIAYLYQGNEDHGAVFCLRRDALVLESWAGILSTLRISRGYDPRLCRITFRALFR